MSGSLSVQELGSRAVITLAGEIDLQNSPQLRQTLLDLFGDHLEVVVDLAGVTYIDSSGIACFVEAYQLARNRGLGFSLAAVSPQAMRVLKLARLDEVFTLIDRADPAGI